MLTLCTLFHPPPLPWCCVCGELGLRRKESRDGMLSRVIHSPAASPPWGWHMCREHSPAHPLDRADVGAGRKADPRAALPFPEAGLSPPLTFLQRQNTTPPQPNLPFSGTCSQAWLKQDVAQGRICLRICFSPCSFTRI